MAVGTTHNNRDQSSLNLPRILCLHGGGTNARIFRAQCRVLEAHLKSRFRLVYPNAPFPAQPGADVLSVYAEWGPFRKWIPGEKLDVQKMCAEEIDECIQEAMYEDDMKGGTGEWVGLLGFSQGAKIGASLLYRQQQNDAVSDHYYGFSISEPKWRFAVLMAGRAPIVMLEPSALSEQYQTELLRLPTLHVHGLADPGLEHHRRLLTDACDEDSVRLAEWNGGHRIPVKTKDVASVVFQILDLARETGVLVDY